MKKLLSVTMVVFLAGPAFAAMGKMDTGEKIRDMKAQLGLTDNQADAVKPILEDYKSRMEALNKEKEQKISAVLTPDQMSRWNNMKKDHYKMKRTE